MKNVLFLDLNNENCNHSIIRDENKNLDSENIDENDYFEDWIEPHFRYLKLKGF